MVAAPAGKEWFTVPQAARALEVGRQAIYEAVKAGRLQAAGDGWERRIHAEHILRYALRTGRDIEAVARRLMAEKEGEIDWNEVLGWVLVAAGLAFLIAKIREK